MSAAAKPASSSLLRQAAADGKWPDPVRVEPAATRTALNATMIARCCVAAHLADKAAPGLSAGGRRQTASGGHPMQCCVREDRVKLAVEGQILAGHYPRVDAAGAGCRDHVGRRIDSYNRSTRRNILVNTPSPQPKSRMRSPADGASSSSAGAPSAGTKWAVSA
jgi:hypothetical protein